MITNIFHRLVHGRRRFRHMTFDELGELYGSMMLRTFAISMAGIFVPVYLFQIGYTVAQVLLFFAVVFGSQTLVVRPVAHLLARIGPKHTIALSFILQAIVLVLTAFIASLPDHTIWLLAVMYGLANLLFFTAFNVDFSRFKHGKKSGKEVGVAYVMERVGAVSGPLIGGLVAYFFAPQYIFLVAVILLAAAALPLIVSVEHLKTRQRLDFSKLRLRDIRRDVISYAAVVNDTAMSMIVWPLFLGVVVFSDKPYLQLGFIMSLSIILSVVAARGMGKMIDNKQGRQLLKVGVIANAGVYLLRPFTNSFGMALGLNIARECITPAIRMPHLKGVFDAADEHPGLRIVYIARLELVATATRGVIFGLAALAAYYWNDGRSLFIALFAVGALVSLGILTERFKALNPPRRPW